MDACLTYIPSVRFHPDAAKRCLKRHGKDSRLSSEGYPCKPLYCRQLEALYKGTSRADAQSCFCPSVQQAFTVYLPLARPCTRGSHILCLRLMVPWQVDGVTLKTRAVLNDPIVVRMWKLDHKEGWAPKDWCFPTVVLKKTPESPLDCKEIQPVHPKGSQSWVFIGRTDAEAEAPILWPPDGKNWLIW